MISIIRRLNGTIDLEYPIYWRILAIATTLLMITIRWRVSKDKIQR